MSQTSISSNHSIKELEEKLKEEGFSVKVSKDFNSIHFENIEAHVQVSDREDYLIFEGIMCVEETSDINEVINHFK